MVAWMKWQWIWTNDFCGVTSYKWEKGSQRDSEISALPVFVPPPPSLTLAFRGWSSQWPPSPGLIHSWQWTVKSSLLHSSSSSPGCQKEGNPSESGPSNGSWSLPDSTRFLGRNEFSLLQIIKKWRCQPKRGKGGLFKNQRLTAKNQRWHVVVF